MNKKAVAEAFEESKAHITVGREAVEAVGAYPAGILCR